MRLRKRSDRLLAVLQAFHGELVVVAHDNPDPDAIAAGWGLAHLIKVKLGRNVRLVSRGAVMRAENIRMVQLTQPPLEFVPQVFAGTGAMLVDCSPDANNQLLAGTDICPLAVVDHHQVGKRRRQVPFWDVRKNVGASASIVSLYLLEQSVLPTVPLATALMYALKTETKGAASVYSGLDLRVIRWLTNLADHNKLADIENAPLRKDYYADLVLAVQNTFLYEDVAFCILPSVASVETVGEIADLVIRCEGVRAALCAGRVGDKVSISSRTRKGGGDAAKLLEQTLKGQGYFGGHQHRAGAQIPVEDNREGIKTELQTTLRTNWLEACAVTKTRGSRLVARRKILENL